MATSARLEELKQKFNENPRRYFAPLANEHRKLGDLDQAIALCRQHLPQQPQHVSGHIVLAQALFEAGNVPDSRGTFELALDLDPENLIALRFLGDIARKQGEHLAARQWYERVLDADPRNDEIAQLIRDLEREAPAPRAREEALAPREEVAASAETPNELDAIPVAESSWTESAPAAEPIEDLATAWQHETAALDSGSFEDPGPPSAAEALEPAAAHEAHGEPEPVYSINEYAPPSYTAEPEVSDLPVTEPELDLPELPVTETELTLPEPEPEPQHTRVDEPVVEAPNESWAEPDEEFVATVPEVMSEAPPAPPPFREIDYSMFEAVADEEEIARAEPESAAPQETPPARAPADDWFEQPQGREAEPVAEATSENAFDLDAAFQSVLPNKSEETQAEQEPVESSLSEPSQTEWADEVHASQPDETPVAASQEGPDSVDDAFATLDAMTANLESEQAEPEIDPGDQRYIAPEFIGASHHIDALVAKTPDSGVPTVEEAPSAFVTETMAELYLQQGFREEALSVYRQLLALNPDDSVLAARVRALEGSESAGDTGDLDSFRLAPARPDALGQSMRAFLGVFARRRAPMRRRAMPSPPSPAPSAAPSAVPSAVPASTPEPVSHAAAGSGLSALFGAPQSGDEGSAAVLAGVFAEPNADLPGRPTRAAEAELSLGDVFGGGAGATARAASFDEFFSTGSAERPAASPLDEEGSDMVQFTAWLEGLKKK